MRYVLLIILLFTLLLAGCGPAVSTDPVIISDDRYDASVQVTVTFDRTASYARDKDGRVLAVMYFDKPVLSGYPEVVPKINAYFDEECNGFFYGSEKSEHFKEGTFERFFALAAEMKDMYGDDVLAESPLTNTVDTEVACLSPKILSIKMRVNWLAGGVHNVYVHGATFDLKTGELLSVKHFVKADIAAFNQRVISLLYDYLSDYGTLGIKDREAFNEDWEAGVTNRAKFEAEQMGRAFEDYEYYYDGADVWLIFREYSQLDNSYVIKYADKAS